MKSLDILLTETRRIENDGLRQLFLNARTRYPPDSERGKSGDRRPVTRWMR
jgi:hypothetical protein